MKKNKFTFLLALISLLVSCSEHTSEPIQKKTSDKKIVVQTVNYPLFFFAKQLAGDKFDLRYIVSPGEDPAFWKPSDKNVQDFQQADIIIQNGAGYAKWIKTVSLPSRISLDTSAAFSAALIREKGKSHQHGNGKAHQHGDLAFTLWLDFSLAEKQAQAIATRFAMASPQSEAHIHASIQKLSTTLQTLDKQMMAWSQKWGDKPLLVSHPVYQYWAKRYGLNIRAVHWEPDMKWNIERAKELDAINSDGEAKWMIWEGPPAPALVEALKEKGIKSVVFTPCANSPDEGTDWISVMKKNLSSLEAITP